MTTLQIRIEDDLKKQATVICNELGLDISTAVRLFFKKMVLVGGIPFDMKVSESTKNDILEIDNSKNTSNSIGVSEMSLEEMSEEIRLARLEKREKWLANI